jgi:hypothetical protein
MPEHLNAEIASSIITDTPTAIDWLKHSFFYIRVCANPGHYGVGTGGGTGAGEHLHPEP